MNKDKASLHDIIESMRLAVTYIGDDSLATFEAESMKVDAVVRRIGILGEAVKRLSMPLPDAHADIPWKDMAGMRDRVNHGYDMLDTELVYKTVTEEIPSMIPKLVAIEANLPESS